MAGDCDCVAYDVCLDNREEDEGMKNWRVPAVVLVLLIMAMAFRWGSISSSTNNGIATKTLVDRWNGAIWQETIKNGNYDDKIVSPSWFESMRKPIEEQVNYLEPVYSNPLPNNRFASLVKDVKYVSKTEIIQKPPLPIYWISSNGITKIWGWLIGVNVIWLLYAVGKTKRIKLGQEGE